VGTDATGEQSARLIAERWPGNKISDFSHKTI
jgi:hypothetical protein